MICFLTIIPHITYIWTTAYAIWETLITDPWNEIGVRCTLSGGHASVARNQSNNIVILPIHNTWEIFKTKKQPFLFISSTHLTMKRQIYKYFTQKVRNTRSLRKVWHFQVLIYCCLDLAEQLYLSINYLSIFIMIGYYSYKQCTVQPTLHLDHPQNPAQLKKTHKWNQYIKAKKPHYKYCYSVMSIIFLNQLVSRDFWYRLMHNEYMSTPVIPHTRNYHLTRIRFWRIISK